MTNEYNTTDDHFGVIMRRSVPTEQRDKGQLLGESAVLTDSGTSICKFEACEIRALHSLQLNPIFGLLETDWAI